MNRVKKSLCSLMVAVAVLVTSIVPNIYAQNFSDIVATEVVDVEEEGDSTMQILVDQAFSSNLDIVGETSQYTLGKTDVIQILVLRHPEVSGQYVVNNEGNIQYEFIGDVKVDGLRKDGVKAVLEKFLSEYIISPEITVKIVGYNSKIVYVIGEVGHPGKILMMGDTITVREALVQAGLPLLSAKASQSRVITPSESGKAQQKKVNVQKLLYEGDLRENLVMKPGDTLYVPPTILAKTMRVLQPVAAPIGTAASTGRTVTTGF